MAILYQIWYIASDWQSILLEAKVLPKADFGLSVALEFNFAMMSDL